MADLSTKRRNSFHISKNLFQGGNSNIQELPLFCVPMKKLTYIAICLLLGFAVGYLAHRPATIETVRTRVDTVYYAKPTPVAVSTERRIVSVPRLLFAPADTVTIVRTVAVADSSDSLTLDVAIEHREYRDSTYRAVVSGAVVGDLRPTLDFIETYNRTTTVAVERPKRFAVTAGVGAAYTPKGFQPYVGVGVGVVIWRF